jgi:hypothetical protein
MTRFAVLLALTALCMHAAERPGDSVNNTQPVDEKLEWVTLEMSLKPFKDNSDGELRRVSREMFRQWAPLASHAKGLAVMLWTADGSEILD